MLAAALTMCFDVARASLAFWFEDINGFTIATDLIRTVLSGAVVPLALMPVALADLMAWQPFRLFVSFPIEVAFDQTVDGVAIGFAQQIGLVGDHGRIGVRPVAVGFAALLGSRGLTWSR